MAFTWQPSRGCTLVVLTSALISALARFVTGYVFSEFGFVLLCGVFACEARTRLWGVLWLSTWFAWLGSHSCLCDTPIGCVPEFVPWISFRFYTLVVAVLHRLGLLRQCNCGGFPLTCTSISREIAQVVWRFIALGSCAILAAFHLSILSADVKHPRHLFMTTHGCSFMITYRVWQSIFAAVTNTTPPSHIGHKALRFDWSVHLVCLSVHFVPPTYGIGFHWADDTLRGVALSSGSHSQAARNRGGIKGHSKYVRVVEIVRFSLHWGSNMVEHPSFT